MEIDRLDRLCGERAVRGPGGRDRRRGRCSQWSRATRAHLVDLDIKGQCLVRRLAGFNGENASAWRELVDEHREQSDVCADVEHARIRRDLDAVAQIHTAVNDRLVNELGFGAICHDSRASG